MRQSDVTVGVLPTAYLRIIMDVGCVYDSADLATRVKHPHFLRGLHCFYIPPIRHKPAIHIHHPRGSVENHCRMPKPRHWPDCCGLDLLLPLQRRGWANCERTGQEVAAEMRMHKSQEGTGLVPACRRSPVTRGWTRERNMGEGVRPRVQQLTQTDNSCT